MVTFRGQGVKSIGYGGSSRARPMLPSSPVSGKPAKTPLFPFSCTPYDGAHSPAAFVLAKQRVVTAEGPSFGCTVETP